MKSLTIKDKISTISQLSNDFSMSKSLDMSEKNFSEFEVFEIIRKKIYLELYVGKTFSRDIISNDFSIPKLGSNPIYPKGYIYKTLVGFDI